MYLPWKKVSPKQIFHKFLDMQRNPQSKKCWVKLMWRERKPHFKYCILLKKEET